MRINMRIKVIFSVLLCSFLLFGCGKEDGVNIMMMSPAGITSEESDKLELLLQSKLGEELTVKLNAIPLFTEEKLVLEVAAGHNSVLIIPEEPFRQLAEHGGYFIPLNQIADEKAYPEGVVETTVKEELQTGLFGIPLGKTKWFNEAAMKGRGLIAFIPSNAPDADKALQVMKIIGEPADAQ